MKGLPPGACRHPISIQRNTETVDPATGYRTKAWADLIPRVMAQFLPGPGAEYLASEALRASVTGRFVFPYFAAGAAILASDRVIWDGRTMEIKAPPIPDSTGRISLTLMVAETGTDGA